MAYLASRVAVKLTKSYVPLRSATRLSRSSRLPVELSCCLETMMPLHSAIASARLKSSLSVEAKCWGLIPQEPSRKLFSSTNPYLILNDLRKRSIGTLTEQKDHIKDVESYESPDSSVKINAYSSLKVSSRHDLGMLFTCKVCETRSMKMMSRESYEKGVVVARCGGCDNLHLIADHMGWFGQPGTVEDFLAARGEEVKQGSIDTLNLTLEDVAGKHLKKTTDG